MITPRRTRLIRASDLHAFRRAIAKLTARDTVVVVPSQAAAWQLRRCLAAAAQEALLVTRDQLYEAFRVRLPSPPAPLEDVERDVIAQAAARAASAVAKYPASEEHPPATRLRPGLVAEMLRFYDLLRRQGQQVRRFEELITERIAPQIESDLGAVRMLEQTRFLAAAFTEYERLVLASGKCDEHLLRGLLIRQPPAEPIPHVVVTVPDWIADPNGLFVADFDLLSRIPGLERIDIVSTETMLGSGFHERLHNWWPGIDEETAGRLDSAAAPHKPFLSVPNETALWATVRDRHEELAAIARTLVRDRHMAKNRRAAVVYKRPLPYVYVAPETLGNEGIPFETVDGVPLAAEPTAAALDLVLEATANGFTRADSIALLRSPHFRFMWSNGDGRRELTRGQISALDRELSDTRYLGEISKLQGLMPAMTALARPAAEVILAIAGDLSPLMQSDRASAQADRIARWFEGALRPLGEGDTGAERERRVRGIVLAGIRRIGSAHADHDNVAWTVDDLAAAIRRWIEDQTVEPSERTGLGRLGQPVVLLDDRAARYGDFDDITIVGLVEGDWPERSRRNIFYGSSLMSALGWPSEKDRRAAAESRFLDLLSSASRSVALSTFTLEDEALVEPSILLDEVGRARLSTVVCERFDLSQAPSDEALSHEVLNRARVPSAHSWARIRTARSSRELSAYHGQTDPPPARPWSVSAVETYLGCPFRFFAQHVLRLEEDPDDDEVMDPREQGEFVHRVFELFFRRWQASGRGAITPDNLGEARALFTEVVDGEAVTLPGAEAALERTRLLGSPAVAGLGEAVLRMEAERPEPVVERLLEHRLDGEFTIATSAGARSVALRGKADRLDLLADGTFRLIDYKLGWPPDRRKALQLPIYSLCAEQQLAGRRGRDWQLGEAVYLAFKGPRRVVPLLSSAESKAEVMAAAQQRLADALDAISRGEFPPTPDDVHRCESCAFTSVCRKDYVGDV